MAASARATSRSGRPANACATASARLTVGAAPASSPRKVSGASGFPLDSTTLPPTAQRNLDVVRRTWELGRGTLLDVITEQRRLIEIENGYTDALRQVFDATVEIDRAVGLTSTAPRG
jgi:hypothetical protein